MDKKYRCCLTLLYALYWLLTTKEEFVHTILSFCRSTVPSSPASLKRYYFEHLQLNSTQLKFSVSSASRLPEDLQSLKGSLGLILVNLEDASIDLGMSKTKVYVKIYAGSNHFPSVLTLFGKSAHLKPPQPTKWPRPQFRNMLRKLSLEFWKPDLSVILVFQFVVCYFVLTFFASFVEKSSVLFCPIITNHA